MRSRQDCDEHDAIQGGNMSGQVTVEYDGPIATITNDNQDKRNAFSDAMDAQLFAILGELKARPDLRCVIWRGEGHSWSSGRDVAAIGGQQVELTHHELMSRGHRGILQIFELDAPIIVPIQGWAIGGSFQRALLCDIRIAADDAKFMLPETGHGVIPDTGGVGRLYEMCGHGVVSDMVIQHLSEPEVRSSMADELIYQTFINKSDDYAEFRAARNEQREPQYRGS